VTDFCNEKPTYVVREDEVKYVSLIFFSVFFSGCSDSNEAFAAKVKHHMSEIANSDEARQKAMTLCRPLPEDRRSEEAQCVALQQEAHGGMYRVPPPSDRSKDKGF
jgi:hypothetical protein